jgi:hypothetical protein
MDANQQPWTSEFLASYRKQTSGPEVRGERLPQFMLCIAVITSRVPPSIKGAIRKGAHASVLWGDDLLSLDGVLMDSKCGSYSELNISRGSSLWTALVDVWSPTRPAGHFSHTRVSVAIQAAMLRPALTVVVPKTSPVPLR